MIGEARSARRKLSNACACLLPLICLAALATSASAAPRTLAVSLAGTGFGSVTDDGSGVPAPLNCPGTCSANYPFGKMVPLTATPAAGSSFSGWSGGGCAGTGSCTVTLDSPGLSTTTVIATFTAATGQRAAALKKCKHKHGHKRKKCRKKANLLPV